jgi:hypothetical protein
MEDNAAGPIKVSKTATSNLKVFFARSLIKVQEGDAKSFEPRVGKRRRLSSGVTRKTISSPSKMTFHSV